MEAARSRMSPTRHDQIEGAFRQALGRGFAPRLSIGTRQLSIRCSSDHFGPSLSLPVNAGRVLPVGMVLAELRFPSCASAQEMAPARVSALNVNCKSKRIEASMDCFIAG